MKLAKITVADNGEPLDDELVAQLAQSMARVGLLQPVGVNPQAELLFGRKRLAAAKQLGWEDIDARLLRLTGDDAELAVIDENLVRSDRTALDWAQLVARRKELYEEKYPETAHGTASGSPKGGKEPNSGSLPPSFVEDTAKRMGQSRSTVKQDAKLGADIDEAAATQLHGSKVANNKSQLAKLAKLTPAKQRMAAGLIGEGSTFKAAMEAATKKTRKRKQGAPVKPVFDEALIDKPIKAISSLLDKRAVARKLWSHSDKGRRVDDPGKAKELAAHQACRAALATLDGEWRKWRKIK